MRPSVAAVRRHLPWIALALFACLPLFVVDYPPIQDLPFHLAAIRVIHSIGDPAYGLSEHFELALGRTQYVLYYVAGSALATVLGVARANVVLMCVYFGGTLLAMRSLLGALGKDERLALFVVPLLVNVMSLFGLLPFLTGIPVMLWASAAAIRWHAKPTVGAGVAVALLGAALFYLHVFPFALFALAFAAFFPWRTPRAWARASLPSLPSVALVAWWTLFTAEGKLARGAFTNPEEASKLGPFGKFADAFNWLGDVWRDLSDEALWGAALVLGVLAVALGRRDEDAVRRAALKWMIVPIGCVFLFVTGPEKHGHIWLIWQRLPILFCFAIVPMLRFPEGRRGRALTGALVALAVLSTANTAWHFIRFQRDDVDDLDVVMAAMEPRKKVAGLVFDPRSSVSHREPFLHVVSYCQVKNGGVSEFTFAGYPHWPFSFKPGKEPPQGSPAVLGWEWHPTRVKIEELHPYYDYVLTREEGFAPPPGTFKVKLRHRRWTVWERE